MSNDKKRFIFLIGALVALIAIAVFILDSLTGDETPPVETEVETSAGGTGQGEEFNTHENHPVVFDESPEQATVSTLTLSAPQIVNGSYNPESATNFKGSYKDERVYVIGAKGQFYHYRLDDKQTYTYENLVKEGFVDKLTGDVVFTKEIIDSGGKIGVYKALKTYPDLVLIHEIGPNTVLEEAAFFKGNVVLNLFDTQTREASAVVKPMAENTLNDVGQNLSKSINGNQFNFATDGIRLFAYDAEKNAIVELSNGVPRVHQQFDVPVNNPKTAVLGEHVLTSFNTLSDGKGYTYDNGKKIFDQSFLEMVFYDEDFLFVRDNEQSYLLDRLIPDLSPLTQLAYSLSVTPDNLYYVNDYGEIKKIGIKKNAE